MSDFDYGAEPVASAGGKFKNPTVGKHAARIRSIIHLGICIEYFDKKAKPAAPEVVVVFELKEDGDFADDGETPLEISKAFPLRKGDKAFMTKFLKAVDPDGTSSGFDDFIGKVVEVELKGSKELDDDKKPKYVNFAGISSLHPKLVAITDELSVAGVGHCKFVDLTEAAVKELNPIMEVANLMMAGPTYAGSKAESIVNAIRVDNPEFAKAKAKTDSKPSGSTEGTNSEPEEPREPAEKPAELEADEEF